MTAKVFDSKALERKAWGRVFQDGIFDIYVGLVLLNAAVWMAAAELGSSYADTAGPAFVWLLLALGLYRAAKQRITAPRLGQFEIERRRTSKARLAAGISVGVLVLLVAFTALAVFVEFPDGFPLALVLFGILALQAVVLFSLGAYFTGVQRFYLYGILAAVGFAAAEVLVATQDLARGWDVVGTLGLPALVMLPVGAVLLKRFLRDYPVEDSSDAA